MRTYRATATLDDDGLYLVHVHGLPHDAGWTQGTDLADAAVMARSLIAVLLEIDQAEFRVVLSTA